MDEYRVGTHRVMTKSETTGTEITGTQTTWPTQLCTRHSLYRERPRHQVAKREPGPRASLAKIGTDQDRNPKRRTPAETGESGDICPRHPKPQDIDPVRTQPSTDAEHETRPSRRPTYRRVARSRERGRQKRRRKNGTRKNGPHTRPGPEHNQVNKPNSGTIQFQRARSPRTHPRHVHTHEHPRGRARPTAR